jgi:hypothetical protein
VVSANLSPVVRICPAEDAIGHEGRCPIPNRAGHTQLRGSEALQEAEMGKNQWVVRRGPEWGVRGEGNSRDTSVHSTQASAIDAARDIARNQQSQVVIQDRGGRIRDVDSYGSDPFPPRDKKH